MWLFSISDVLFPQIWLDLWQRSMKIIIGNASSYFLDQRSLFTCSCFDDLTLSLWFLLSLLLQYLGLNFFTSKIMTFFFNFAINLYFILTGGPHRCTSCGSHWKISHLHWAWFQTVSEQTLRPHLHYTQTHIHTKWALNLSLRVTWTLLCCLTLSVTVTDANLSKDRRKTKKKR